LFTNRRVLRFLKELKNTFSFLTVEEKGKKTAWMSKATFLVAVITKGRKLVIKNRCWLKTQSLLFVHHVQHVCVTKK